LRHGSPIRVGVPDLLSNSYFPALAAVELGFFAAEGLDADLRHVFPVSKTMEALRDDQLDLVAGSAHAPLTAFPDWHGAKLIAALSQKMYWLLVLRPDLGAKKGDVQAIKGLRIGAAPGPDVALRRLLIDAGIDPTRDQVEIAPVPGGAGPGVSFGVQAARCLETGVIDGFWANGMGSELAVRSGVGTVILDVRRGLGPPAAQTYTFPALVTTEYKIEWDPEMVKSAVRAIVKVQQALRADPALATKVGQRLFPPAEAEIIAQVVERDLPYYDAGISEEAVAGLNRFAREIGLLSGPVAYQQVVATRFQDLWPKN